MSIKQDQKKTTRRWIPTGKKRQEARERECAEHALGKHVNDRLARGKDKQESEKVHPT